MCMPVCRGDCADRERMLDNRHQAGGGAATELEDGAERGHLHAVTLTGLSTVRTAPSVVVMCRLLPIGNRQRLSSFVWSNAPAIDFDSPATNQAASQSADHRRRSVEV